MCRGKVQMARPAQPEDLEAIAGAMGAAPLQVKVLEAGR